MRRATIRQTGPNEVTLTGTDPLTGGATRRVFRIGARHCVEDDRGRPVCEMLLEHGDQLVADDGVDLLYTVRREWSAYRRWARERLG